MDSTTSTRGICISNKLRVHPGNLIMVPGCEPITSFSGSLARFSTCTHTYVSLEDALDAIPGSYVELQINTGFIGGIRQKLFVLPPYCPDCPCNNPVDYYGILRSLPPSGVDEEDPPCQTFDLGVCRLNEEAEIPPVYPYKPEGSFNNNVAGMLINRPGLFEPHLADNNEVVIA